MLVNSYFPVALVTEVTDPTEWQERIYVSSIMITTHNVFSKSNALQYARKTATTVAAVL